MLISKMDNVGQYIPDPKYYVMDLFEGLDNRNFVLDKVHAGWCVSSIAEAKTQFFNRLVNFYIHEFKHFCPDSEDKIDVIDKTDELITNTDGLKRHFPHLKLVCILHYGTGGGLHSNFEWLVLKRRKRVKGIRLVEYKRRKIDNTCHL